LGVIGLMLVVPALSKYFKIHESTLYMLICASLCLGSVVTALCHQIWQFYLAQVNNNL
jgi:hypothetical protein